MNIKMIIKTKILIINKRKNKSLKNKVLIQIQIKLGIFVF